MRRWIVVCACAASLAACQKKSPTHAFSPEQASAQAEAYLGEDEARAKALIEELTDLIVLNIDDADRVEQRIEAFLLMRNDELVQNARALEAILAAKSGDERVVYEENFSNYLAPATLAYSSAIKAFAEKYTSHWRRVDRRLKAAMTRQSGVSTDP